MKPKLFIGIDPDVDKNGVGINYNGKMSLCNLAFFKLFDKLIELKKEDAVVLVVVEGGWLNKNNWHTQKKLSAAANAKIGEKTGRNHETGRKIVEMLEYLDIKHVVTRPSKTKISAQVFKMMTGIKSRSNQEQRDAYMLIHGL